MERQDLTQARTEAGWSIEEFAQITGVSYNTIWRYEHGPLAIPRWLEILAALIPDKKNRRIVEKFLP